MGSKIFFDSFSTFSMAKIDPTKAMLDPQIASPIWDTPEYGISCMMDCEVLCEDCGGIEEKDLWVIIVSLGGAIIALIIIFSCAIHYLKKKYRNKLAAVRIC